MPRAIYQGIDGIGAIGDLFVEVFDLRGLTDVASYMENSGLARGNFSEPIVASRTNKEIMTILRERKGGAETRTRARYHDRLPGSHFYLDCLNN